MKKWEYLIEILPLLQLKKEQGKGKKECHLSVDNRQGFLDTLGEEGWELVFITPPSIGSPAIAYFKREIT